MTTIEEMANFTLESYDQGNDQTYYLVTQRMRGDGEHGGYTFYGLPGFWNLSGDNHRDAFEVNQWYEMRIRLGKVKTGKNASPGSRYTDIMKSRLADEANIPVSQPGEPRTEAPSPQGAGNPSTAKEMYNGYQDKYRRSKEEMRWTEALHMATRICAYEQPEGTTMAGWAQELAGYFYSLLETPPDWVNAPKEPNPTATRPAPAPDPMDSPGNGPPALESEDDLPF